MPVGYKRDPMTSTMPRPRRALVGAFQHFLVSIFELEPTNYPATREYNEALWPFRPEHRHLNRHLMLRDKYLLVAPLYLNATTRQIAAEADARWRAPFQPAAYLL